MIAGTLRSRENATSAPNRRGIRRVPQRPTGRHGISRRAGAPPRRSGPRRPRAGAAGARTPAPGGSRAISISTTPASMSRRRTSPARSSRSSMSRLSARTSAEKRSTPSSRARSASRESSAVPRPRPWASSVTVTAASASPASSWLRTKRATPMPSPLSASNGDQRLVVVVVDLGEVRELRVAEPRLRREEAPVARLGAQALERLRQDGPVLGRDRAHEGGGPVAQLDPLAGRLGTARRLSTAVVCRRAHRHACACAARARERTVRACARSRVSAASGRSRSSRSSRSSPAARCTCSVRRAPATPSGRRWSPCCSSR